MEEKAKNGHIAEEDPIAILWRIASGTLVPGMINILLAVTPFAAFQGSGESWSGFFCNWGLSCRIQPDIFSLKQESSIFRSVIQPCSDSFG